MQQHFGTGNIIGVSTAIIIGGVGSVFWIFLSGIFAIATKYAETYLCMKYRIKDKNKYYGGTMYVLSNRVGSEVLGFLFALFVIISSFGIGCMIQSNAVVTSIIQIYDINIIILGIVISIIGAYIIFSNERRIAKISSVLVPISIIVYIFMLLYLTYIFKDNLYNTISIIIDDAFSLKSSSIGVLAFLGMRALSTGLSKGMFSNEAGMGSSPIFETTVSNTDIKEQSIISSTSVLIDTVIICSLTGIALVSSNMYINEVNPVRLVQNVFGIIPFGSYLLTFCIISFSFATIPCWGYYGMQAVRYIFRRKKTYQTIYKMIYVVCIYIGAISTLEMVWTLSSIANAFMVLPNIYMIYYLLDEIK